MAHDRAWRARATASGSRADGLKEVRRMDSALYTKPYAGTDDGAFSLPEDVEWAVLPRYVGRREDGGQIVDERITVVLQDRPNRFWPAIVKMSVAEAERLKAELARVIAERQGLDGTAG